MADRLYCALNGTTLRDLDARIHLLDVEELAPAVRTVTASRIGGGLHLLRRQREQLSLRDRKSTRLNSSHPLSSRMPSSA